MLVLLSKREYDDLVKKGSAMDLRVEEQLEEHKKQLHKQLADGMTRVLRQPSAFRSQEDLCKQLASVLIELLR